MLETLTQAKDADELQTAWQRMLPHFDTLFCTEDSIDQLKQTILQLAIMGRLVKQDPNDEPASNLLKEIKAEKEKSIREGKIKKEQPLANITDEDELFEIPKNWKWVRLGDIAQLSGGFAYQSSLLIDSSEHQVIRMGNIRPDFLRLDENPVFISEDQAIDTSAYKIEVGDIIITMTGTKNKKDYLYSLLIDEHVLANKTLYLNQRLCLVRTILINPDFINKIIKDGRLLDSVYAQSTGTANQANIGMAALKNWIIPLPPLKEQKYIVAKVKELMTLCDSLGNKISKAEEIKVSLSKAIVENAIA